MFFTGAPCTTLRTASSTILLLLVRGMSVTCTTFAGTWRGVVFARIVLLDAVDQRVVERDAVRAA